MDFNEKQNALFAPLGQSAQMVLATSLDDIVSARTMSIIILEGRFYFQTDKTSSKCAQIKGNKNVALCWENIRFEGICAEIGTPAEHAFFLRRYEKAFPEAFAAYSTLENERLFEVRPRFAQRFIYEDRKPCIETFDFQSREYRMSPYAGK